jgi:hypothetical protein
MESGLKMAKNKMAEVAKLFGKKLNEPFKIRFNILNGEVNGVISYEYYAFTENGLYKILEMGTSIEAYALLYLLNGNAEIVED